MLWYRNVTTATVPQASASYTVRYNFSQFHIASVAAWDSMNLIYDAIRALGPDASGEAIVKFMAGREYQSPRGPIKIDAKERDIIQNIYIRRVVKRNGKLENMNIDVLKNVRDPWKDDNPAKK